ncbi:MAG TPA: DUF937 domain-containing protein, partial [Rubrobacter sp.]|nr:DUF937 domain-containing protein [Rubrobacter sp.]
ESGLGRATGLDAGTMAKLLALLAPIVLGYLGRQQRQSNLDAGGLSDYLGGERQRIEQNPQANKGLGSLLDADGDGQILDDLMGMAGGFLGGKR